MSLRQVITKVIFPAVERQTRAVSDKLSHVATSPALKAQPQQQQQTVASYASVSVPTRWKAIQYHAAA